MAEKETFGTDFRRFFLRGLAAVLPTLLTIAIIFYVFGFVHDNLGKHINSLAVYIIARAVDKPFDDIWAFWDHYLWWVGFLLGISAIYIFGRFVASFIGRSIWRLFERAFHRVPVVRQIYPSVKQVTDFLLSEKKLDFSRVVAVEYPRKGVYSLG